MSDQKFRICCVIHSLCPGGMERVMSELISHFSKKENVEIHLILYGIKRDIFYSIPDSVILHKPDFEFNNSIRILHTIRTLFYLRNQVKKIDPYTILSFGELWNNFVLLALYGLNYPVYVSDRCRPNKKLGRLHEFLRNRLYPEAKGIIAQTEKAKQVYFRKFQHPNIEVIGNPIRKVENESVSSIKENIVLTVGRLIDTKHHDRLIDLFLNIDKPGWKLVIVGGDAQKQNVMERLQRQVKRMNAVDKVLLEGNQADVDSYYNRCKIFAFTSSSEGFPNVIGEAMSAGLPVIAFDCIAGPSEMIDDGKNGFLIPLFDYETFEDKLTSLIESEELRHKLGKNAEQNIRKYSVEKISEKYFGFIINEKLTKTPHESRVLSV